MRRQGRKVLLFIDNAPCHSTIELFNVKLTFFPPNTTVQTQPLDAGIIKNFKYHSRKYLLEKLVNGIDSG
jgi:hypothetical protein